MSYHSLPDILQTIPEQSVIQLTDDNGLGAVDADLVAGFIRQTDNEIDTYLCGRYRLPLPSPVPVLLTGLACDITIYKLYKRTQEIVAETRQKAYQYALAALRDIRDGKTVLPYPSATGDDFASGVVETSRDYRTPWGPT